MQVPICPPVCKQISCLMMSLSIQPFWCKPFSCCHSLVRYSFSVNSTTGWLHPSVPANPDAKTLESNRLWHQKWVKFLILNMTFIMLCHALVPCSPFWLQSQQHPWRAVYLNPISLFRWKRNERQESAQLPNNTANALLPNLAVQTSQTDTETERSLWNKSRSLRRWQPIIKMGVSSQNICVLQIFLLACPWESLWPWKSLQWHEAFLTLCAEKKQMLSQLGVLLFLLSRVQAEQIQVPLLVQCPSSGGECAAPAHPLVPHWQTMTELGLTST